MIPYDELCAALDRYVTRKRGGVADSSPEPAQVSMPTGYSTQPDLDMTHVGGPAGPDSEIDLVDVLSDEESN